MKAQPADTHAAGDDLSLIFAAAFRLKVTAVRTSIMSKLDSWIESCRPSHGEDEVRDCLDRQQGTPLEPFVLDADDREIAVMAARLAFSRLGGQTRFRVVSRETLGLSGGVVLTDNLKSYFAERYSRGERRSCPEWAWFVAPAEIERPEIELSRTAKSRVEASLLAKERQNRRLRVELQSGRDGLQLVITNIRCRPPMGGRPFHSVRDFQEHGRVLDDGRTDRGRSFDEIGLRVTKEKRQIRISTGSPESILRLTAMAAERRIIELRTTPVGTPGGRLFIRLWELDGNSRELRYVNTVASASPIASNKCEWMRLEPGETVGLSAEQKLEISRWLAPHDSWITSKLLEELV